MGFHVVYVAGGELDKVKKVNYVDKIHNFAYKEQPYSKMSHINLPALCAVFKLEYITPDREMELQSLVVTCTGYGEDDYYYLFVNNELWLDTWFPTEVKEGLFIGTSTYVKTIPPNTKLTLFYVNVSGTAKKVWLGVRMIGDDYENPTIIDPIIDTTSLAEPYAPMDVTELSVT